MPENLPLPPLDLHHPYLTRQLIAYLGNKRRLLPLIHAGISCALGSSGRDPGCGLTFLDLFAGSGAVSRLAKLMGFRVLCNDWEEYARVINTAHVATDASEAARLFVPEGGLAAALGRLASPPAALELADGDRYVSRYYAPGTDDVEAADYRTERLFYTRSNALLIDLMRSRIERLCPPGDLTEDAVKRRSLLIAPLLYEAATHTNTSGVFKACHKGFGGHGRDALKRILAPIEPEVPVLLDSRSPSRVFASDANLLARSLSLDRVEVDLAYLDPPYATHQYGSNYHLLTSIARWDRTPAPLDLDARGVLRDKSGIRRDWVTTRSAYCSRSTAPRVLQDLLGELRARMVLVSYSSEGLIPFERLLELCQDRGSVRVLSNEYTTYPGGKKSSGRLTRNVEVLLVVDTSRPASAMSRRAAELALERRRLSLLFRRRLARTRLDGHYLGSSTGGRLLLRSGSTALSVQVRRDGSLLEPALDGLDLQELRALGVELEACLCRDAEEELVELLRISRDGQGAESGLAASLASALRRLTHRKNRHVFRLWLEELRSLARSAPDSWRALDAELDGIQSQAERRFGG